MSDRRTTPEGTTRAVQPGVLYPPPTPEVGRVALTESQQAGMNRPLGGRKPTLPAGQPPGTGPRTSVRSPVQPNTVVSWHAYVPIRIRTRIENLPLHTHQAKSGMPSASSPFGDGRGSPDSIARTAATPRSRRLIPAGAGGWAGAGGRIVQINSERAGGQLTAGRQPVTGLVLTCCRSRSRTPRAARPRRSPDRTRSRQDRCRNPAGRPRTWHPRSARPGCSGTRACRCRPG